MDAKVKEAIKLLKEVLGDKGSSIGNEDAATIIEIVVKSTGNKIVDFIVQDK